MVLNVIYILTTPKCISNADLSSYLLDLSIHHPKGIISITSKTELLISPPHCPQLFSLQLPHLSRWQLTLQLPLPLCHIVLPVHQKNILASSALSVYPASDPSHHFTMMFWSSHHYFLYEFLQLSDIFLPPLTSGLFSIEQLDEFYNVSQILSFICSEYCDVSPFLPE